MRVVLLASCLFAIAGCSLDIDRLYGAHDGGPQRDAARDGDVPDAPISDVGPTDAPVIDVGAIDAGSRCGCGRTTLQVVTSIPISESSEYLVSGVGASGDALIGVSSHDGNHVHLLTPTRLGDCTITATETVLGASAPGPLQIVDFDHDGATDVIVATDTGSVAFVYGMSGGGFQAPTTFTAGSVAAVALHVARLDGDTLLDLVVWDGGTQVHAFRQRSARDVQTLGGPSGSGITYRDGVLADVDGDGVLDLTGVYATTTAATVTAMLGDGAGLFGGPTSANVSLSTSRLAFGRFSGPRDTLITVGGDEVAFADDAAALAAMRSVITGADLRDVVVADLDGVSPPEIVVADASANVLHVLHWMVGTTEISTVATIPIALAPTAIAALDVDGDGQDELAVLAAGQVFIATQDCTP